MKEVPFIDQPLVIRRKHLKNKNFSIICQSCIAAVVYHDLGMKFLTPTINLYFQAADFIELLKHLHSYMNGELIEDKNSNKPFPVGILKCSDRDNQIKLYFNHYSNFDQAREKWDVRKKRINYDNLYIVGCDHYGSPYSNEDLKEFNKLPYEHKVIITGNSHLDNGTSFSIPDCDVSGHIGDWWERIDNVRHSRFFEKWNYVDFLNKKN